MDEKIAIIKEALARPGFGDLVHGPGMRDFYWLRDVAVPVLLECVEGMKKLETQLREALAREGGETARLNSEDVLRSS